MMLKKEAFKMEGREVLRQALIKAVTAGDFDVHVMLLHGAFIHYKTMAQDDVAMLKTHGKFLLVLVDELKTVLPKLAPDAFPPGFPEWVAHLRELLEKC